MLGRIFIAFTSLPGLKKRSWRVLYNFLARWEGTPDWTFMNYGYAATSPVPLALEERDEGNRHWIQLYHHVAGAVDLRGGSVLEIGSGRGGGASFIKRYLHPQRMIGIDLSQNAVDLCRRQHAVDGLEFRVGDAENVPVDDNSMDAVVNVESSHCYPSFDKFLAEVRRVLRPGGHFLYADFRDRANVEGWRESLLQSGLILVRETDITPNVIAALDRDNETKLVFINRMVPKFLRPSFLEFAAMRGTGMFESFRNGSLTYVSFVMQKPTERVRKSL